MLQPITAQVDHTSQARLQNMNSLDNDIDGTANNFTNGQPEEQWDSNTGSSTNQFAGLLEAVTTVVDQESDRRTGRKETGSALTRHPSRRMTETSNPALEPVVVDPGLANDERAAADAVKSATIRSRPITGKRKRGSDDGCSGSANDRVNGSTEMAPREADPLTLDIRAFSPQSYISDAARAAGVHSAVALFRQPSSSSRKSSRPPMSKLFKAIALSPENFFRLQAAAKLYMLDGNHPERRECVGNRGRGDREMVKLRLYKCVKTFLEEEGHGERFFGRDMVQEGVPARTLVWPEEKER